MSEHTFLVAVTVEADSREEAEKVIDLRMRGDGRVVSWRVAEDDLHELSDEEKVPPHHFDGDPCKGSTVSGYAQVLGGVLTCNYCGWKAAE